MAVFVSGTTVVSASTRGTNVAVGFGAAEPLAAAAGLADAAALAADGLADAAALAGAGLAALVAAGLLAAAGALEGAAVPPPQAARATAMAAAKGSDRPFMTFLLRPLQRGLGEVLCADASIITQPMLAFSRRSVACMDSCKLRAS
jgi:phosphosulfolactate phosphohydrolase-like enzyme